jgi:hypothetical protein
MARSYLGCGGRWIGGPSTLPPRDSFSKKSIFQKSPAFWAGQKDLRMSDLVERSITRKHSEFPCANCGRKIERRARQQRFCSRRCRQQAHYVEKVDRGDFSTPTIALPTNPPKKDRQIKALQRAKTLSSNRIFGPPQVLAVEVFERSWQQATSSGGVAIEIGRLRERALVGRP